MLAGRGPSAADDVHKTPQQTDFHPSASLKAPLLQTDMQRIMVTSLRSVPIAAQHTMHCLLSSRAELTLKAFSPGDQQCVA